MYTPSLVSPLSGVHVPLAASVHKVPGQHMSEPPSCVSCPLVAHSMDYLGCGHTAWVASPTRSSSRRAEESSVLSDAASPLLSPGMRAGSAFLLALKNSCHDRQPCS
jgi:hypothetical protein